MKFEGYTLHRIRLLPTSLFYIKGKGGGWIQGEHNLSHEDDCFVQDEAKVFGNAHVEGEVIVENNAIVKDNAQIKGETILSGNVIIGADTTILGKSHIYGNAKIFFYSSVSGGDKEKSNISGESEIMGNTTIEATGHIYDSYISDQSLFGHLNMAKETLLEF